MSTTLFSIILFRFFFSLSHRVIYNNRIFLKNVMLIFSYTTVEHLARWILRFFTAALKKAISLYRFSRLVTNTLPISCLRFVDEFQMMQNQSHKSEEERNERNKRLSIEKYDYCVKNDTDKGYNTHRDAMTYSSEAKRSKVDLNVLILVILE